MTRIGNLFERICDLSTLEAASHRAAQGKRHRREVAAFMASLEAETAQLAGELQSGSYGFAGYRVFKVRDTKTREIHAPSFRDRVVHHAIIAVAGPVFEMGATSRSFACRRERGQHSAIETARPWVRRQRWFLKLDISKFYDSIPQDNLLGELQRRFGKRRLLQLLEALVASYESSPGRGIPIGALTSQYLGNFYLDSFDRWVLQERRHPLYLRYMDDMLFIGSREEVESIRPLALLRLRDLGLTVKHGGILNACRLGVPWLGFTLYPDRLRLCFQGRRRLRRTWRALEKSWIQGDLDDGDLQRRTEALFAHAQSADDVAWRRMVCTFSRIGEAQGPATRSAWRFVEQPGGELPVRDPQREPSRESEQEQRLPPGAGPRHDDFVSTDDAPSRARWQHRDKTMRKPSSPTEVSGEYPGKKAGDEAAAGGEA